MNNNEWLAYHESMELHEILNFKSTAILKAKMLQGVVFDQDIKKLLEKDVKTSIQHIHDLQEVYKQSQLLQEEQTR